MTTYNKPTITKRTSLQLTRQEHQLIARLRQKRRNGDKVAEVVLDAEDGPRVREQAA